MQRLFVLWILVILSSNGWAANKPNIILVFTDDQGWTDTSVQMMANLPESRNDLYQTPALERMARQGMVFSNALSSPPTMIVSVASRAPMSPPLTGASNACTFFSARVAAIRRATAGLIVELSTNTCPS